MTETRLIRALRTLLPSLFPREPYLGPRKYRLVRMRPSVSSATLTRGELQIVSPATGMPDLLFVDFWPGVAGTRTELTPGAYVLVQFIDGDPQQPIITHCSTPDDPAWKPVNTVIDATGTVQIGPSASSVQACFAKNYVLRAGDSISITPGNGSGVVSGVIALIAPSTSPDTSLVQGHSLMKA